MQWVTIRRAAMVVLCGIFVGSQFYESRRLLDAATSSGALDAAVFNPPMHPETAAQNASSGVANASSSSEIPRAQPKAVVVQTTNEISREAKPGDASLSKSEVEPPEKLPELAVEMIPEVSLEAQSDSSLSKSEAVEIPEPVQEVAVETPTEIAQEAQPDTSQSTSVVTAGPLPKAASGVVPDNQKTMNACLFIMDDSIRLLEWLAYHYVVLPLGHLVVAVDPKSRRADNITRVLEMWKPYIDIDVYYNDSFLTLDPHDGWGRQVWGPNNRYRGWFKNKRGFTYRSQAHKRRQNFFASHCFSFLWEKNNRQWTLLTDTDEFVTYNYRYPETEDESKYDSETDSTSREDIDEERRIHLPLRESLPSMARHMTIADFLYEYVRDNFNSTLDTPRCIRVPGLTFSSHESNSTIIASDTPANFNATRLMTLRQRQHAAKDGKFSKAMLNLKTALGVEWFQMGNVLNVHTPNRRMCGRTTKKGATGSGADYISSLFRIHHYKAGTIESYLERTGDFRGGSLWRFYSDRNSDPVGENSDLVPWLKWFVEKVGEEAANKLLFQPMQATYEEIESLRQIKEAKKAIAKLVPSLGIGGSSAPPSEEPSIYTRTNKTISACMYVLDDTLRLMEWIAYHYTVLPLGYLVLGLDPRSRREAEIAKLINTWEPFVRIEKWANDSWLENIDAMDGWKRRIVDGNNKTFDWYNDKNSSEYKAQVHKRRQNTFIGTCLNHMHHIGHNWTLVTDSDEFIVYNYKGDGEDINLYDTVTDERPIFQTKEGVDKSRAAVAHIRKDLLPPLTEHVTVMDFVAQTNLSTPCIRVPGLKFSAHQDAMERLELPPSANLLITLVQHRTGPKEGKFSKTLLDVSVGNPKKLNYGFVESIHNPNRGICRFNGRSGSAADYIASVLRINHYAAGTMENQVERSADWRNDNYSSPFERFIKGRSFDPVGVNHDIDNWIDWFILKVGMKNAEHLLFKPLKSANAVFAHYNTVKEAKTEMQKMGIIPSSSGQSIVELNDEGEAEDEED